MRLPFLVALFSIWSLGAVAQTVEYDIPTSYELVQGRLAVTFVEDLPIERAEALMDSLSLTVFARNFRAVNATLQFDAPPSAEQVERLRSSALVVGVIPVTKGTFASGVFEIVCVPHATLVEIERLVEAIAGVRASAEARASAGAGATAGATASIEHFEKLPNELEVETAEGDEEASVRRLESLREVRYVSYIHEAR